MTMAEMQGFGKMDINDRGGKHTYEYDDVATTPATPGLTPSQTVGPFFAYGLTPGPYGYAHEEIHETDLTTPELDGERIVVEGQVLDSNGVAVHDAVVEFIQADASGTYASEPRNDGFTGFHGLAQCFQGARLEFWQLVEKQDAVMSQHHLTGQGAMPATDECGL